MFVMNNLAGIAVAFAISLALFHSLLFIPKLRRSGLFWHIVDYVWLFTAAVALAFATIDIQKWGLRNSIEERRTNARIELNRIRMHTASVWEFMQGTRDKDGGHECIEWFRRVSEELETGLDSFRWKIFVSQNYDDLISHRENPESRTSYILNPLWKTYKFRLDLATPELDEEATAVVHDLNTVSDEKDAIGKMEGELSLLDRNQSFRSFWPWILCLALALRITKVTADLVKYEGSAKNLNRNANHVTPDEVKVESDAP